MLTYQSIAEIITAANESGSPIWRVVLDDHVKTTETSEEDIISRMTLSLEVMKRSAAEGMNPEIRSMSGLSGGDGFRMNEYAKGGNTIGGSFNAKATATALAIMEYNAAMGKIVAAPTAGSCGIMPAGLLTMMQERGITDEQAVQALITAGAMGMVIANKASISGAQGGCQAECGTASAMTAAALVELMGGTPEMCGHAVSIALQNILGLVCDPVAGLVEVPCILRNGSGISIAINAADMALAGIESIIPVDEVITAMDEVGNAMPASLRETALGGLATTPTGIAIKEKIFG